MNILKVILSIGAGLLATAACYVGMSKENKSDNFSDKVNNQLDDEEGFPRPSKLVAEKSDNILSKLDKLQVALINLARFISEVVRAISLFIRATRGYEYDPRWRMG